jgi:hypothetical protein
VNKLKCTFERQIRKFPRCVFRHPESPTFDRSTKADASVGLGRHKRMFACLVRVNFGTRPHLRGSACSYKGALSTRSECARGIECPE